MAKVEVNNGEVNPSNTEIYLKVNFAEIKTEDLLNQHNCTLTYQIPDFCVMLKEWEIFMKVQNQ